MVRQSEPGLLTRRLQHVRPKPTPAGRQDAPACTSMFGRLVAARPALGHLEIKWAITGFSVIEPSTHGGGCNPLASPFLQPYIEINSRSDRSAS